MASPDNTVISPGNGIIVDSAGHTWTINSGNQVLVDGQPAGFTAGVILAAYEGGNVWQENSQTLWWEWNPNSADNFTGWSPSAGTSVSPIPSGGTPSPDNTIIHPGDGNVITDAKGNQWTLSADGHVLDDGQLAGFTANVTEVAFEDGNIWQENNQNLWWEWNPSAADNNTGWSPSAGTPVSPVKGTGVTPVVRTWIATGDNNASNPNNWSPTGAPQPGDSLQVKTAATLNVVGDALAGDQVSFEDGTQTPSPSATVSVSGASHFGINTGNAGYGPVTVNLADQSQWIGGVTANPFGGGVDIHANGSASFANTTSKVGNNVGVDAPVVGAGSFEVIGSHGGPPKLEFIHSVAASQSVQVLGGTYGNNYGVLQVDDIADYHASTQLGFGEVILKGLAATSYSLAKDLLTLFNGNSVAYTMNLSLGGSIGQPATGFGVCQVGGDIFIHANGSAYNAGGVALPGVVG